MKKNGIVSKKNLRLICSKNALIILLLFTFGFSGTLYSQNLLLSKEIQFREHTTTIKDFLKELSKAGEFTFSYGQDIPDEKEVHILPVKQSVKKHLDYVFNGYSIIYIEQGNKILLVKSVEKPTEKIPRQTIKGRILDLDSKMPLSGVNVILSSVSPAKGVSSDENGYFKFENIGIGRHSLKFSHVGYEPYLISEFQVASGKEYVVLVDMEESIVNLKEINVTQSINNSEPVNDLAFLSARKFSAREVENYPGSFNDISRAAVSFPGVVSANDGQNHIVIRGNSPKGLQWRLEGIEVPNLNHFGDIGASGGGVNIISNNMVAASDFFSSAFPAEYGNALSGVFDLRLRTGNNDKHEQTAQVGLIGTELMVEGPINRETNTTYIAQYRYSTFKLIESLGANLESVPDFQDLSFKIYHPTKKLGIFSLFGIGGLSHEVGNSGYDMNSNTATIGLTNSYTVNPKTFIKSVVSFSGWKYTWDENNNIGSSENPIDQDWKTSIRDYTLKASFSVNKKINVKHKVKAGIIYEKTFDKSFIGWHSDTLLNWNADPLHPEFGNINYFHNYVNTKLNASTLQTYFNWKYRLNEALTISSGIHYLKFFLNKNYSVEPRLGLQWQFLKNHTVSAGFGVHSRKESLTLYAGELELHDGTVIQPNIDLELAKARHYVLGYNFRISKFLNLRTEAYYQDLYDIPASPFPPYFSSVNFDYGFEGSVLTNHGTAFNRGIEVMLEKFNSHGYFFLLNGSLYESKFKNKLGAELHTKYDGTYASNGMFGKEFKLGKAKQNVLSVSTRYILMGGMRRLPIDKERSIAEERQINIWDKGFTEKSDDYFRIDLQFKLTRNKPSYTSEWTIDIINLTNRKNMLKEEWNNRIKAFVKEYQNPIIPMLTYRIQF